MTARKSQPQTEPQASQPLLSESSTQRMTWERQIQNAEDEKRLIDLQRESLVRINDVTRREADAMFNATMETATKVRDRAISDADSITSQGIIALDERTADLDKIIAGLTAAVGASE